MKLSKWFVSGLVAAIAVFMYQFVVHTFALASHYEIVKPFMRPEGEFDMAVWLIWAFALDLIVSLGLGYMFLKGYEGKGIGEAVRFGFWAGLVFGAYFWIFHWLLFPGPFSNSIIQIAVVTVEFVVATVVFFSLYKPSKVNR